MVDLKNGWGDNNPPSGGSVEDDTPSRYVYGILERDDNTEHSVFIRKEQIHIPGTHDEWATTAVEYYDFDHAEWIIDNSLQEELDSNFFTILEESDFYRALHMQEVFHSNKSHHEYSP